MITKPRRSNAHTISPRLIALVAALFGTALGCAMIAGQGSSPDRATDSAAVIPPGNRPMSDLISLSSALTTPPTQAKANPATVYQPGIIQFSSSHTGAWPDHLLGQAMDPFERLDRFDPAPRLTPDEVTERLSIRPLRNSSTAYTRNTLMLHGYDQLTVLAGPSVSSYSFESPSDSILIPHSTIQPPIDLNQHINTQRQPAPPQPAP